MYFVLCAPFITFCVIFAVTAGYDKIRGNEDGSSSNRCSTPFVLCIHIFKSHKAGDRIGPVNSLLISLANKPAAAGPSLGLVLRRWHLCGTGCSHGAL